MRVPEGYSEAEVLRVIEDVVLRLAPTFTFGYFDRDDIAQEARIEAMKVLELDIYDPSRKLDNFLFIHVKNRLLNLKRNKWHRTDPPCMVCHSGKKHDGEFCRKYVLWRDRNGSKRNIMSPLPLGSADDFRSEDSVEDMVVAEDLRKLIDSELPVELRSTYLKMLVGKSVPPSKRRLVEGTILEILRRGGYAGEEGEV